MTSPITVFTAEKIVTMEPSLPEATAVAVRDGLIVSVGTLESLQPWLEAHPHEIVDTFRDKVIFPGFIDNHLHPKLITLLLSGRHIIAPYDWELPTVTYKGVHGKDAYLAQFRQLNADYPGDDPLIAWGYHDLFHGDVTRHDLDTVSTERAVIAWHRSGHEIICNTKALDWLNITPETGKTHHVIQYDIGRVSEGALIVHAFQVLGPHLTSPEKMMQGLELARELIHRGGITTIGDNMFGLTSPADEELPLFQQAFDNDATPFRTILIPVAAGMFRFYGDEALAKVDALQERSSRRLVFNRSVKGFADGAFISQLMQLRPPGYIDGHHGEWMTLPEDLGAQFRPFWRAGYQIQVHVNGDRGLDATLDILQELLEDHPRYDHRYCLEHFGYSAPDQVDRVAALGATVSANGYYVYFWGDRYSESGLGPDRAGGIIRLGSLVKKGVRVSLHADTPMAPAKPLLAVWAVVTRRTAGGQILGSEEALTLDQALRAITIDAAYARGMEHQIGSISAGKKADFTILEHDPYAVPVDEIKDIPIWGTVFEGTVYPVGA